MVEFEYEEMERDNDYEDGKQKRVQSKDDVVYGVFGCGDSESDDEGLGSKKKTDYSKPVRFVSTGFVMPTQEIEHASSKKEEEDDDLLPTAFGKIIREEKAKTNGVGEFEKHSKGIGMKLLEKMGYKGGGLGKNEQGIMAPIEAKLRPKNMGMGFNEYKEVLRPPIHEKSVPRPTKQKLWLCSNPKKKKKAYITAEQVLLPHKEDKGFQVVFDMRGPQLRVLTNLQNLNAQEEIDVPMPQLEHQIKLILDNIHKLDTNLRNERERVVALRKEKEKLQKEAHHQKQRLRNMEEIISVVLDQMAVEKSLESLASSFTDLRTRFPDEYTSCNLSCIACSYALPLFITKFQGWDPLQNPSHGTELVSLWKHNLLQGKEESLYVQLFMEVVFPAVRISVTNSWQPRDAEPMLRYLETWERLLPPRIRQAILDTLVMPKISSAVDSWDPRTETIPIHEWIHPWLPELGHKLENCYHTIRNRLASVLHAWHPSDISAFAILSPWQTVFDPASWEQLMVRYIFPKLLTVMHELQINPANQKLEQFDWVVNWVTAIPTHHMLQLMDVFFNKWEQVLYHWLCSKPSFEQVTNWYINWKELLPQELLANEHIRFRLNLGLAMMKQAVQGMEVAPPGLKQNIRCLRQFETQRKAGAQAEGNEMSLKQVIEIHGQRNGLVLKPKAGGRMQDGHQIYGFGNISIIIDSLNQKVFAHTEDRWSLVSLEQLLELQTRPQ